MLNIGLKGFGLTFLSVGRGCVDMADFFKDLDRKQEDLKRQAWETPKEQAGKRFELLDRAASLIAELDGWQGVVESPTLTEKRRQLTNFSRLIGYRPADLYRLVDGKKAVAQDDAVKKEEVSGLVESVGEKSGAVEQRKVLVSADDFQGEFRRLQDLAASGNRESYVSLIYEVNRFEDEFSAYVAKLNPREQRKWARTQAVLRGELRRRIEVGLVYGTPPEFDMTWVLRSDDEAKGEVEKMIASYSERERPKYANLLDKSLPSHPAWFLFLQGAYHSKMTVIGSRTTSVIRGSAQSDEVTYFVSCGVLERAFDGLPKHRFEYIRTLVDFLKTDEFANRTGYKAVMLNGLTAKVDAEFVKKEGLMEFEVPKSHEKPKHVIYGVKVPERGVSLGDILKKSYVDLSQKS